MNYTQNEKIEQVIDATKIVGVDIGSQIYYVEKLFVIKEVGSITTIIGFIAEVEISDILIHINRFRSIQSEINGKRFGKAQRESPQMWEKKTQKNLVSGNGIVT